MAGNAVIGALRVVLGADTAAFEKGLKDAQGSLAGFGNAAKVAGAVIVGALAGTLGGLGVAVKSSINDFDKMSKMSQKIGVPVETLSALKHAADLSDVSIESLEKGIGRLARNSVEAGQGLSTPIRAFEALQISFRDGAGRIKSVSELLPEIADRFSQMRDGPEKTAIAMQLLGRAGADLIPMLNGGAAGLKTMTDEAREFGLVISSQTGKAAEDFNDNLTRLRAVFNGIVVQLSAQLLPSLMKFSEILVQNAKDGSLAKNAADLIGGSLLKLTEIAMTAVTVWQRLGVEWNALREFMQTDIFSGKITENWKKFQEVGRETERIFATLHASFEDDPLGNFSVNVAAAAQTASTAFKPLIVNATEAKKLASEGERAWERMAAAGKRVFEETRTPLEEFRNRVADLNMLFWQGHINAETYERAIAQAQDRMVQANPHAQNLGNALESAFDRAGEKGAKLGDILKSLIVDLAKMEAKTAFRSLLYGNANQGGTSGGLLGGLFGGIGKLFGFAEGGSFKVPGAGGIDSQVFAARVTPGERVSVTKDGGYPFGEGAGQPIVQNFYNTFEGMTGSDRQWAETRMAQVAGQAKQAAISEMRAASARRG